MSKVKKLVVPDKTEQEVNEILAQSEVINTESLFIDAENEIQTVDELKQILIPDFADDPDAKYDKFYYGIQKLLKRGLPKGEKYETLRELVREEINTFLTRGKRKVNGKRGADSRQAYLSDMNLALDALIHWTVQAQSTTELYETFRVLNQKYDSES
ncbi:MAG: hypothetical protein RLZZ628_3128 [Bacteroidota bacterium]|jgi:hypothetical protein